MPAVGVLSHGITFSYKEYASGDTPGTPSGSAVDIDDLQSIPSLGGDVEKVEVTTLADGVRRYINGIKDFGDLEFQFLFDNTTSTSSYRVLRAVEEAKKKVRVSIGIPDGAAGAIGTKFEFDAVFAVSLNEAGVNDPLTYNLVCGLQSDVDVVNA